MKNHKKAFTLVELVVVVTILAVLSTVGFVAFSGYLEGVRDTNRISQLKSLNDGLIAYQSENPLPMPDDYIEIKQGPTIVGYQGYAGDNIISKIEYSSEGIDPKDGVYFTYSITKNKKYFSLMAFLEEESLLEGIALTNKSYAVSYVNRFPYMTGKKVGILIDDTNTPIQENETIKTAGFIDIAALATPYQLYLSNNETYTGSGTSLANFSTNYDCKRLLDMKGSSQDGTYSIDPDGDGVTELAYCDMTTDGGGWTYTTMLADMTTKNLFNTGNNSRVDSITKNISSKGNINNLWVDSRERDIFIKCFTNNSVFKSYEEPLVIYDYPKNAIGFLTNNTKQGNALSFTNLNAKWKNNRYVLATLFGTSTQNESMFIKENITGDTVFSLPAGSTTYKFKISTNHYQKSGSYTSGADASQSIDVNNFCVSAIR